MSYSLMDKLLGKPVIGIREVAGMKIEYRVLTNPERVEIWRKHPVTDIFTAPEAIAVPTLAKAIQSIDGKNLDEFVEVAQLKEQFPTVDVRDLFEKHLATYPYPVINELYQAYVEMISEFQEKLTNLKKNSVASSQDPSGESVKSSEKIQ